MSENITPKLVLLNLKGQKIIRILSPTASTTRQARKYREKTKAKNKTHNTTATIGARRGGDCWQREQKQRWRDAVEIGNTVEMAKWSYDGCYV